MLSRCALLNLVSFEQLIAIPSSSRRVWPRCYTVPRHWTFASQHADFVDPWHCSPQQYDKKYKYKVDVSKNSGTPKSSILMGFSIINHPFWGTSIFGNTQVYEDVLGIRIQDPVAHHNTFGTWTSCSSSPLNHCVQQWEGSRPAKSSKVVASPSHALSPVISRGPSVHLLY